MGLLPVAAAIIHGAPHMRFVRHFLAVAMLSAVCGAGVAHAQRNSPDGPGVMGGQQPSAADTQTSVPQPVDGKALPAAGTAPAAAGPAGADAPAPAAALPSGGSSLGPPRKIQESHYTRPSIKDEMFAHSISYSAALQAIHDGKVDSAFKHYNSHLVIFFLRMKQGGGVVYTVPANATDVERALSSAGVELTVEDGDYLAHAAQMVSFVSSVLFLIFIAFSGWGVVRKFIGSPARRVPKGKRAERITFADVAGQEEAKRELREVVEFLKDPKKYAALGARVPRGVLLDGPPGNGKTLLAKAVAGEAGVEFQQAAGTEFLEMFAGLGARRVRKMFKAARKFRKGCILFIDEIDTLGRRGSGPSSDVQGEREQILNQFLVEMDGIEKRGNVIIIGATNRPDMLDPAFVRPGRLDRRVHVPLPDIKGREAILAVHSKRSRLAKDVSMRELSLMTTGFSGADLENLINEAAIQAGRAGKAEVDMDCFQAARDKALMGESRPASSIDAAERRIAAIHEAGHAIVALRTPGTDPVHKATVLPRGQALGMVVQLPERERKMHSKTFMYTRMVVLMAGRAAEEICFGDDEVTSGASEDIREATRLARLMIGRFGMHEEFGMVDYIGDNGAQGNSSQSMLGLIDVAVREKITAAYAQARAVLSAERSGLVLLADTLQERETMSGPEMLALINAERGRTLALAAPETPVDGSHGGMPLADAAD